jgi:ligand-binding sensor domain-containing protein
MKPRIVVLATLLITTVAILVLAIAPQAALAALKWNRATGGPDSIYSLAYDSAHNVLYAGTAGDGVWKYNGTTWTNTGGAVSSYIIYSLAYDSAHNVLYAGTVSGLWKYNGSTWTDTGGGYGD